MKKLILTSVLPTLIALLSINTFAIDDTIQNTAPENLVYEVTPEGVAFAPLIGQRFHGAYMAIVRLPAGLVSPAHTKSANMFGVVIAGKMTHSAINNKAITPIILPVGSFYKIPKNLPHVSKCVSDIECVTFLYQDGKFDFSPI